MNLDRVTPGQNMPNEINVIIEIPAHSDPVKYEVDKDSGAMFVDRFMTTAMHYPCNYGYVPHTLSKDGDPVDVLVVLPLPMLPGAVMRCRPVGVLQMKDEAGEDFKGMAEKCFDLGAVRGRQVLFGTQFRHVEGLHGGTGLQESGFQCRAAVLDRDALQFVDDLDIDLVLELAAGDDLPGLTVPFGEHAGVVRACGEHEGYRRLPGRVRHRRTVLHRPDGLWVVVSSTACHNRWPSMASRPTSAMRSGSAFWPQACSRNLMYSLI